MKATYVDGIMFLKSEKLQGKVLYGLCKSC